MATPLDTSSCASPAALLLLGFQNDFFHPDGALYAAVEQSVVESNVLANAIEAVERAIDCGVPVFNLPLLYSPDYSELRNPVGLLAQIRDIGAFRRGSPGAQVVPEILAFDEKVTTLHGKTGFNAFFGTQLEETLIATGIERVGVAGIVTSVCVDSTARASAECGFRTTVLSDCTAGKTKVEQDFYCENVFPSYAEVLTAEEWIQDLSVARGSDAEAA